jgi:hypothetical protein
MVQNDQDFSSQPTHDPQTQDVNEQFYDAIALDDLSGEEEEDSEQEEEQLLLRKCKVANNDKCITLMLCFCRKKFLMNFAFGNMYRW